MIFKTSDRFIYENDIIILMISKREDQSETRFYTHVPRDVSMQAIHLTIPFTDQIGNLSTPNHQYKCVISYSCTPLEEDTFDIKVSAQPRLSEGGTIENVARFFGDVEKILGPYDGGNGNRKSS